MTKNVILCVDDETIILDSLREQLERHFGDGYLYETAENAKEGFEIIEDLTSEGIKILIIVSDWLMPGIKGDEFLIRVHKKFPSIVKVLLTGHANEDAIKRAEEEAALFAIVHKPWSDTELFDIINAGLNKNE
ncbi:MAG: response regulator [Bacteroidales bacterium]|nr:response regulator [Bacteroidales bacterium]